MPSKQIGIIGIGNMGMALLKGIISSKIEGCDSITIYDTNQELMEKISKELNIESAQNNKTLVRDSKYVIIAVKPQIIDSILEEISPLISEHNIIISIAAGISIEHIQHHIKKRISIVRVMPNTPALVREGASVLCHNGKISPKDLDYIKEIFNAVGMVLELEEKHIDAVTGLSGSGPAYIFIIIEALSDGGVKMGLPRDIALKLSAQTVLGSAKMYLELKAHPGVLKDMVTSPGGTTITALHEIEKGKLRATLISAVESATLKSRNIQLK